MTEAAGHQLVHLPPAASRLGAAFARPKLIALACVVLLAGTGWFYLGLQAAGVLDVFCKPIWEAGQSSVASVAVLATMWSAMTLAMMLPSAAPMILTYAEIADTAAQKGDVVVSPFVIASGYAAVWLGFAAVATAAQIALAHAAMIDARMASASGLFSGTILIGAGIYQFSALKHACLKQCQHPFQFFFANWKTAPRGVFGLGLRQGMYCLGCCWAMMLVMFSVGVMNIVWMAALGIVMALEKIGTGKRFTYAVGAVLIAVGTSFIVTALVAHWLGQTI